MEKKIRMKQSGSPTMFPHGATFSRKRGIISFRDQIPKCLRRKYRK
jgi:hypothetical protein